MGKATSAQRKLLADSVSNIGVAWFAGGVVGAFVNKSATVVDLIISISWGLGLSILSIFLAFYLLKGVKA